MNKEELNHMIGLADRLHPDEGHILDQTKAIVKSILQRAIDLSETVEKDMNK